MKAACVCLLAVFLGALATPAAAQGVDVTGTWSLVFSTDQGPIAAQMVLKKDGQKIYGTISSDIGAADVEAAVKDKALTVGFAMTPASGGGPLNVTLNATVDGNAIAGTFDLNGQPGGEFKGSRDAAAKDAPKDAKDQAKDQPKVDVNGTWSVQVVTSTISASPTITLKQDGEKVTGSYVSSQYGEFPLAGTIKGNKIEIAFTMTIEGNSMNVGYAGTVEGDGMKGNVNYGDMAEGTFTATRKK